MRGKIISLLLCSIMLICLMTGCEHHGAEIGLVTTTGLIDDKSFNQAAWEAIKDYSLVYDTTCRYYSPEEMSIAAYEDMFEKAIADGAKVVVCPGFLFEVPVYDFQEKYPDIYFILIDGEPHNEDFSKYLVKDHTMAVSFKEEEAGYLAGYLAVEEGYRNLGFLGGMAVPSVMDYGFGYIQGIRDAAEEFQVDVTIRYDYTGNFDATDETEALASTWYQEGTEVIFACGGAAGGSIMDAAEANSGKVIGVDVDQSEESNTVIYSAVKKIGDAVYKGLADYNKDKFAGGINQNFMAKNNGIGLTMDTARVEYITENDYNQIYSKLESGKITVLNHNTISEYEELITGLEHIKIAK